jgi:serpin B
VVSPYCLGSALHLLLLGATGAAEKSLQALLPTDMGAGKQDEGLALLKRHVLGASRDKLRLTLSSAVFLPASAESARRSPRFLARARDILDATVEVLDFRSPGALERINAWASGATQGLVPRVLDDLDPEARFVLANAVYFNGAWQTAFNPVRTAKAPFTLIDGSTREAAMMAATMRIGHAAFGNLQAVWLPYDGGEVAMLAIAPGDGQGPTAVANALKGRSLHDLMAEAQEQRRMATVQVRLPRFRAESRLDVAEALAELGLKAALGAGAGYEAIGGPGNGPLQVIHRAVLEVNEAGTKAAATTAVVTERSLAPTTPLFSADRPFAFAIVHEPTQAILFAGYIADPGDTPPSPTAGPKSVR